jgi:uncharacterized phage protein (TIGR01671 family)
MSREFKFRAWDKDKKRMEMLSHSEDVIFLPKNRELMQYTGLKDKNGKEIYEGDVVNVTRTEYCSCPTCEGEHKETFNNRRVQWLNEKQARWGWLGKGWQNFELGDEFEIVGNIYENSDLIKE